MKNIDISICCFGGFFFRFKINLYIIRDISNMLLMFLVLLIVIIEYKIIKIYIKCERFICLII